MPDILAIVSKAVFEKDARVQGKPVQPGDVWPVDRYNSTARGLASLEGGGRIFLVTVRPPNEELWFLGVVDAPKSDGYAWISAKNNALPVTNITQLRKTMVFESGKGLSQDKGTLGMSLQTPRVLLPSDVAQIIGMVNGVPVAVQPPKFTKTEVSADKRAPARIIGDKYEILHPIGQGGMGVVYEARHTGTGRHVAVKEIVAGELKDDPQVSQRLEREARATGAIESQHIALMLDSGTDRATKSPFLVMELLHGEDLQQIMVRNGALPQEVAICIAAQACIGLGRAHEAGVIHRDIKPANLFLARRESTRLGPRRSGEEIVVKLLDFGIARMREGMAGSTGMTRALTSTGLMLGTPLYMSPEQVTNPKSVDPRTDLWSLGVVLYEMLTGATPHADVETLGGLLVAICSRPARSVIEVAPHVRRSIGAIVKKALAIDPKDRYATAEEFLTDLTKELSLGVTLTDEMIGLKPASVRAEPDARAAFELASTSPAAPKSEAKEGAPNGTMRSATPIPGVRFRPGGERKE